MQQGKIRGGGLGGNPPHFLLILALKKNCPRAYEQLKTSKNFFVNYQKYIYEPPLPNRAPHGFVLPPFRARSQLRRSPAAQKPDFFPAYKFK